MKLNPEILQEQEYDAQGSYESCLNAQGLYNSMQFVLRLRPDLHNKLDSIENKDGIAHSADFEALQVLSVVFHETIHWWQHIGSTTGFILSLTHPTQTHVNHSHLIDYLKYTGAVKPINKYNKLKAKDFNPTDNEFQTINQILNNFHDIDFFKELIIESRSAQKISSHSLFESVGHSFHITYATSISLLSFFDPELIFLPNAKKWDDEFRALTEKEVPGYFYGSPIYSPPVGLRELLEGQARFSQLQYLYFGSGKNLTWENFEDLGMLNGFYVSAFNVFLEITKSKKPETIDSPLIALFLLVIDISINPGEGFPFDIKNFDIFLDIADPGKRFYYLCLQIGENHKDLKTLIKSYSASEYYEAATRLSRSINAPSPLEIAEKISSWAREAKLITELMEEEKTFNYKPENYPISLIFSKFIRYQEDKIKYPHYLCWPGIYCCGEAINEDFAALYAEHTPLFMDKADGDIYPKIIPRKTPEQTKKNFDTFYAWLITYDLCRQWIVSDGDFEYDFSWLTSKFSRSETKAWADAHFKKMFGKSIDEFKIL